MDESPERTVLVMTIDRDSSRLFPPPRQMPRRYSTSIISGTIGMEQRLLRSVPKMLFRAIEFVECTNQLIGAKPVHSNRMCWYDLANWISLSLA